MPKIVDSITLECKAGSKDAIYALQIEQVAEGFLVHFQKQLQGGVVARVRSHFAADRNCR
jgi:hypothetical protein